MKTAFYRWAVVGMVVLIAAGSLPVAGSLPLAGSLHTGVQHVLAQDAGQRYSNPGLGMAFDLPAGWQVSAGENGLIAASPDDLQAAQSGAVPSGLVVRAIVGTFNELGIDDATQIPTLLTRLVPGEGSVSTPEPVIWGGAEGFQLVASLPGEGYTTRVGLLAIPGGRVALLRGLAPVAAWDAGAGAQFEALIQSLEFNPPERDEEYIASLTTNDGGVIRHYQEPQPEGRVVRAGGIVYDMFDLMYMAAGPGGIAALEMSTSRRISYMGPWYGGDFVDVAMGPDTKLYLANVAPDTLNAVMVVDRAGNWLRGWGERGDGDGQFAPGMPRTIAVDAGGDVWTISEGHSAGIANRLYKFDEVGNLLMTIDLAEINPNLSGAKLTYNPATGGLYIIGATGNLNVVDGSGRALAIDLAQDVLTGTTPVAIAVAPNNNIVVALNAPGLDGFGLLELSVAGRLLDMFGIPFDSSRGGAYFAGEYLNPGGLMVGQDGLIYWTETNPNTGYTQIQTFTFSGDGLIPLGAPAADTASAEGLPPIDPARGGGSLSYGQTERGPLNNLYPSHNWTFEGTAGDRIIVTMRDATGADLLDPLVILADSQGREVAQNDDAAPDAPGVETLGPRDSRLEYALPATGVYTIKATRFGGRGEYTLTLDRAG